MIGQNVFLKAGRLFCRLLWSFCRQSMQLQVSKQNNSLNHLKQPNNSSKTNDFTLYKQLDKSYWTLRKSIQDFSEFNSLTVLSRQKNEKMKDRKTVKVQKNVK